MNNVSSYDPNEAARNFQASDNWRLFNLKFAENFYTLKNEHADFPAWFNLAMNTEHRFPVLLRALEVVEESIYGTNTKPTVKKVSRAYNKLCVEFLSTTVNQSSCQLCNNRRSVYNVETVIQSKPTLLDQSTPIACIAYATTAKCICNGGQKQHTDKRFLPPKEDGIELTGCEHIAQRIFIDECRILLRNQS